MCEAVRIVNTVNESQRLNELKMPAVIIAATCTIAMHGTAARLTTRPAMVTR